MAGWVINMNKKKSKTITIILIIMIFGLIGTIFYITNILLTPDATKSKIAARKSKAADITYTKDVSLDPTKTSCPDDVRQCPDGSYVKRVLPNCEFTACPEQPSPTPVVNDSAPSPTPGNIIQPITSTPAISQPSPTPTTEPSPEGANPTTEPSPTSVVLADSGSSSQSTYNSSTSYDISPTITPMTSLPQTGLVNNSIIVFGLSSLLLFFAFLY